MTVAQDAHPLTGNVRVFTGIIGHAQIGFKAQLKSRTLDQSSGDGKIGRFLPPLSSAMLAIGSLLA